VTPEQRTPESDRHLDVAAYALGILDPRDAAAFEEHLATCDLCAEQLDELVGLGPILAEYAEAAPPHETPAPHERPPAAGAGAAHEAADPQLGALIDRVAAARRRSRLRRMYALAAAVVLIIGGPVVASVIASGAHSGSGAATNAAGAALPITGTQHSAADAATGVSGTVGLAATKWGTHVALKLSGVKGPLTCDLVAVSRTGQQQTVASWLVPAPGYGVPGAEAPLVLYGAAGMNTGDIDHFEVRTTTGQNLLTIPV
jgi:anti-sigma factor RsiW